MHILKDSWSIQAFRFKARLGAGHLVLRRYRLRDAGPLYRLFTPEVFRSTHSAQKRPFASLLFFWFWLHRRFQCFYSICRRHEAGEEIIGFIGLYGIYNSQRMMLAMALFDPLLRGRGYGRQAIDLLLTDLRQGAVVKEVAVEVCGRNSAALAFFQKLGFKCIERSEDVLMLVQSVQRRT